jgi:hypothetical protein
LFCKFSHFTLCYFLWVFNIEIEPAFGAPCDSYVLPPFGSLAVQFQGAAVLATAHDLRTTHVTVEVALEEDGDDATRRWTMHWPVTDVVLAEPAPAFFGPAAAVRSVLS